MFRNFFYLKNIILGLFAGIICGLFASCILPMVVTSGIFYYKNKSIDLKIGILCAIGGIIGGIVGAKLLKKVPTKYLKIAFTIFLIYASYKIIRYI